MARSSHLNLGLPHLIFEAHACVIGSLGTGLMENGELRMVREIKTKN